MIKQIRSRISAQLNSFKDRVYRNPAVKFTYDCKSYFELGIAQISFVTAKLPELMSVVFFGEKMGIYLNFSQIVAIMIIAFLSITIFGYSWKRIGFYDMDRYAQLERDPIMKEIWSNTRETKTMITKMDERLKRLEDGSNRKD